MNLIDDKGRLFGTINIIDALVVLLVLAVAAAGAAFVLGTDDQPTNTNKQTQTTVTFETTGVQPYVADAIPEGPIPNGPVAAVKNKSVRPTEVIVEDDDGELHERTHPRQQTVTLRIILETKETSDGMHFEGEPLEIGRQMTLDLGPVTVEGKVTNLHPDS